jgi:hypothetical protein
MSETGCPVCGYPQLHPDGGSTYDLSPCCGFESVSMVLGETTRSVTALFAKYGWQVVALVIVGEARRTRLGCRQSTSCGGIDREHT